MDCNKENKLVFMRMEIRNMKHILKITNKMVYVLISMKMGKNNVNFKWKMANKMEKKLVFMRMEK